MPNSLVAELRAIVGKDHVLVGEALKSRNNGYWDPTCPEARAIVLPGEVPQLCAIMALCHSARQPVVVQGGLTGLTGAQRTSGHDIAISLERMNRITAFDGDGGNLTAEAGCTLQQVQEYAAARAMLFALDIGARSACTIGGNIATNAGGMEVIRYGMMREQVLGLEAVLADGTLLSSLNRMQKDNAGFDLKQLFIGTEGTLGIVTRAVLRLHPAPSSTETALIACRDFPCVIALLSSARSRLADTLTRFEVMDGGYYRSQTAPGRHRAPMAPDHPWYVLTEMRGNHPDSDQSRVESWLQEILHQGIGEDAVVAKTEEQRKHLWLIREAFEAVLIDKPCFLYDVSLPVRAMENYIARMRSEISHLWPDSVFHCIGHLGDGNLHFFVAPRQPGDSERQKADCDRIIYSPLAELGGSISAEHGIGIDKKPWLSTTRSPVEIALMRKLKGLFDPHNILNPGRVVDI